MSDWSTITNVKSEKNESFSEVSDSGNEEFLKSDNNIGSVDGSRFGEEDISSVASSSASSTDRNTFINDEGSVFGSKSSQDPNDCTQKERHPTSDTARDQQKKEPHADCNDDSDEDNNKATKPKFGFKNACAFVICC